MSIFVIAHQRIILTGVLPIDYKLALVMRFANDFHSWLRHSWKLLANRITRDPNIIIHGNSCIIIYVYN